MNKIEEILKNKGIALTTKCHNYEYLYKTIQESMVEFGKICFEAGRENNFYINEGEFVYKTYEDFLKEIEDMHIVKDSILQIKD
jgi:hypothetical protein